MRINAGPGQVPGQYPTPKVGALGSARRAGHGAQLVRPPRPDPEVAGDAARAAGPRAPGPATVPALSSAIPELEIT